jgi:ATP-dependent Clp protease, protease subunit
MEMMFEMITARRLVLSGDIGLDTVDGLISIISVLKLKGVTEAEIHINSAGGSSESAMHLHDVINSSGIKWKGVVVGKCMSAAVIVLQACNVRQALPNARFLVHKLSRDFRTSLNFESDLDAIKKRLDSEFEKTKAVEQRNRRILQDRVSDPDLFDLWFKNDEVFFAEVALQMGLIDEIVTQV